MLSLLSSPNLFENQLEPVRTSWNRLEPVRSGCSPPTWGSDGAVCQLSSVLLPGLGLPFRVAEEAGILLRKPIRLRPTHQVRKIGLLREVSVELGPVRLLETGAETEIGQLDVASRVQK